MVAPFEETAFSLEIGEISAPVESDFGWHIIQVLGHETRPIASDRVDQLKSEAFQLWLADLRQEADIVIEDNWSDEVPTEPVIPEPYRLPDPTPLPAVEVEE
jgi:parvulin-like peptidyl-prolyl isomerase